MQYSVRVYNSSDKQNMKTELIVQLLNQIKYQVNNKVSLFVRVVAFSSRWSNYLVSNHPISNITIERSLISRYQPEQLIN